LLPDRANHPAFSDGVQDSLSPFNLCHAWPRPDRHYGHLARDGRNHAINLFDSYSSGRTRLPPCGRSGLEPETPFLPSSNEQGTGGKTGKPRARKPRKKKESPRTSDSSCTRVPGRVFPQCCPPIWLGTRSTSG